MQCAHNHTAQTHRMWYEERPLTFCAIPIPIDVEYPDSTLMAHALLSDAHHLVVVFAECYPLDGSRELPSEQALAGLHGPEAHHVVSRAADEET